MSDACGPRLRQSRCHLCVEEVAFVSSAPFPPSPAAPCGVRAAFVGLAWLACLELAFLCTDVAHPPGSGLWILVSTCLSDKVRSWQTCSARGWAVPIFCFEGHQSLSRRPDSVPEWEAAVDIMGVSGHGGLLSNFSFLQTWMLEFCTVAVCHEESSLWD